MRLVNHAVNLDVAAQREPTNAVLRLANLLFQQCKIQHARHGKQEVEEDIELIDPNFKELGEGKMAEFVQANEDRKGQHKLANHGENSQGKFELKIKNYELKIGNYEIAEGDAKHRHFRF